VRIQWTASRVLIVVFLKAGQSYSDCCIIKNIPVYSIQNYLTESETTLLLSLEVMISCILKLIN